MIYKNRFQPEELIVLSYLRLRMNLSEKDTQYLVNLKKGYDGEVMFDHVTTKLQCECFILNDLLLKHNNTTFQIDTLVITSNTIYLFEVKNFDGDYYYESDKLYKKPHFEMINPLHQLDRTESLLKQVLQKLGFTSTINASVVFINPEFTLYQSPLNKPFIFPTQLNRFIKNLSATSSKLTRKHSILAEKLVDLHIEHSPYNQLPSYEYEQLKKGITCLNCSSFSISIEGQWCICLDCDKEEKIEEAVMRNIKEFKALFRDRKITTNLIHDWCNIEVSKKRIKRVLEKNYKTESVNRWTYYV